MAKHTSKRGLQAEQQEDPTADLRKALTKQTKAELVSTLLELAQDRGIFRTLNARFDVSAAPGQLVAATQQAIADSTDFDERRINHNFDYDFEAYDEVKKNLTRLIASGNVRSAMELSLELMKQGSYQVEMSDEGLMTNDIEDCLSVVFEELKKGNLPAAEIVTWCSAMLKNDRVGFIAEEPLEALRNQFQAAPRKGKA